MKLTPLQLREMVGLTQETWRYWRKELAPLHGRQGASPSYTPGEALALRVVRELVDAGIKIQAVRPMADALFDICRDRNWAGLNGCCLLLRPTLGEVAVVDYPLRVDNPDSALVIVPLRGHIDAVQRSLLGGESHPQHELKFPPMGLSRRFAGE